jgi:sortase A
LFLLGAGLLAAGLWGLGASGLVFGKAVLAQALLEAAWRESLAAERPVKPWPWADTAPVARLVAPRQAASLLVLEDASGESLAFGPGLVSGNEREGPTVLAGHRDTHFRFLAELAPGDYLGFQGLGGAWQRFAVVETRVLDRPEARIAFPWGRRLLVLTTCWPFDAVLPGGQERYIVLAEAVDGDSTDIPTHP